jgi:hypothetical protein
MGGQGVGLFVRGIVSDGWCMLFGGICMPAFLVLVCSGAKSVVWD